VAAGHWVCYKRNIAMLRFPWSERREGEGDRMRYRFLLVGALTTLVLGVAAAPAAARPNAGSLTYSGIFRGHGIYTSKADASSRDRLLSVTGVYRPKWSPDGSRISFLAENGDVTRLDSMAPDGSDRTIIVSGAELAPKHRVMSTYDWSPDGSHIVYCAFDSNFRDARSYIVDADGSNRQLISKSACAYDWSEQGRILATRRSRVFVLMDPDGSNRARIEPGTQVGDPEISPAGTKIVFQCGAYAHMDICTIGVDGSRYFHVTQSQRIDWSPTWSPSGTRIMWAPTTEETTRVADLARIRPNGTHKVRLTNTPRIDEYEPDWKA
jgi:Tol biopolymer transport system component